MKEIRQVYNSYNYSDWLQYPVVTTQVCNVLSRGEQVKSCFFEIKGYADRSIDGMDRRAEEVKNKLEGILCDVLDVDIDVCATYGPADEFPTVKHLIGANPVTRN